jgi:uncharacterized protein (TIGR02646 family)
MPLELQEWEAGINQPDNNTSPLAKSKKDGANATVLWRDEKTPQKKLRIQLRKEQFGLCAYCGQELQYDNFPIEHLLPKSKKSNLTFEYYNLVGSCEGNEPIKTEISVVARADGKTIKQVFENQKGENRIFGDNHHIRHEFVKAIIQYSEKGKSLIKIIKKDDVDYDKFIIRKEIVKSIKFQWVDKEDKHCDAKKEDNFVYLLPLSQDSIDKLYLHLSENERNKFISITDNIDFNTNGEVSFSTRSKPTGFKDINDVLNLNQKDLVKKRKDIYDIEIQTALNDILLLEDEDIKQLVLAETLARIEREKGTFYFVKTYFFNLFFRK